MKSGNTIKSVKKVKSLKDLIDTIDWSGIQTKGSSAKLPDDAISFHFTVKTETAKIKNSGNVKSDYARVRFGKDVLSQLNWKTGDKIFISHDPDDHFTFLLCRTESNNGFKLCQETNTTSSRLHFTWRDTYLPVMASNEAQLV